MLSRSSPARTLDAVSVVDMREWQCARAVHWHCLASTASLLAPCLHGRCCVKPTAVPQGCVHNHPITEQAAPGPRLRELPGTSGSTGTAACASEHGRERAGHTCTSLDCRTNSSLLCRSSRWPSHSSFTGPCTMPWMSGPGMTILSMKFASRPCSNRVVMSPRYCSNVVSTAGNVRLFWSGCTCDCGICKAADGSALRLWPTWAALRLLSCSDRAADCCCRPRISALMDPSPS